MIISKEKVVYHAFGLTFQSDIQLPELQYSNELNINTVNVTIKKADLIDMWLNSPRENKEFLIKDNHIIFRIEEVAIFSIIDGIRIEYTPLNENIEDILRLYILGSCIGAILSQRKILTLHGSAIAIEGKAYAFVGESGAGKSTLARAFLSRGYHLISDDVIAVTLSKSNDPIVQPAYPQQKLWDNSLKEFGMNTEDYFPLFEREKKFAVPVHSQFFNKPIPLAGIFEITIRNNDEPNVVPVNKMQRFHMLYTHTYRNFFFELSGLREWHFKTSAKILNKIGTYQIQRPASVFTAQELPALILDIIKNRGDHI